MGLVSWRVLWVVMMLFLAGCGSSVPKDQLDQAEKVVVSALDSWKRGEKPANLTYDALRKGMKLVDFQVVRTEADRAKVIRTFVKLTLQDRKGKQTTEQVGMVVDMTATPTVSCDPFS